MELMELMEQENMSASVRVRECVSKRGCECANMCADVQICVKRACECANMQACERESEYVSV